VTNASVIAGVTSSEGKIAGIAFTTARAERQARKSAIGNLIANIGIKCKSDYG
jgi:hypothetical protein